MASLRPFRFLFASFLQYHNTMSRTPNLGQLAPVFPQGRTQLCEAFRCDSHRGVSAPRPREGLMPVPRAFVRRWRKHVQTGGMTWIRSIKRLPWRNRLNSHQDLWRVAIAKVLEHLRVRMFLRQSAPPATGVSAVGRLSERRFCMAVPARLDYEQRIPSHRLGWAAERKANTTLSRRVRSVPCALKLQSEHKKRYAADRCNDLRL